MIEHTPTGEFSGQKLGQMDPGPGLGRPDFGFGDRGWRNGEQE